MLFPSLAFLFFFLVVLLCDAALRDRAQSRKLFLLGASWFFYACWDWRFLGLILFSTALDWYVARAIHATQAPRRRKHLLWISLGANLGLLGVFKYCDFFLDSLRELLHGLGIHAQIPLLELILPVGISFYTFQTLSYTIDVHQRRLAPARSPLDFALFVAFFPQLVAGPIVRARDFLPQLERNPGPTAQGAARGLHDILAGLFKKVVLADTLGAALVDPVHADPGGAGALAAWAAMYGYAFQIYGDFAGYSQIAIGAGRMLGFRLPMNFRSPYLARDMSDFWRRWHISLSSWLRDYLYIPLGGNRGGKGRTRVNLLLTMLLGGLWHGAGWTFVLWGLLHGAALSISHARAARRHRAGKRRSDTPLAVLGQRLAVFHVWAVSMVLFRATDLATAGELFRALFRAGGPVPAALPLAVLGLAALLHGLGEIWTQRIERAWLRLPPEARGVVAALVLTLVGTVGSGARPFVYFQF